MSAHNSAAPIAQIRRDHPSLSMSYLLLSTRHKIQAEASTLGSVMRSDGRVRHGHATGGRISPEYMAWQHMRTRCNNPNDAGFARYGGRGIRVCQSWDNSFEAFLADVGLRPSRQHSLGRIDNDGNYEPGNVRWETAFQQGSNNSRNRLFTIGGRTMHLTGWVREYGAILNTVHRRLKRGMTIEQALGEDPRRPRRMGAKGGTAKGMAAQARRNAILAEEIVVRICNHPKLSWEDRAQILGEPWSATTLRRKYGS